MARRRNYTLTYNEDKRAWEIRLENSPRVSARKDTKKKAMREGKRLAKQRGTSLEIFTRDGRHQETDTYATVDREGANY